MMDDTAVYMPKKIDKNDVYTMNSRPAYDGRYV